MLSDKAMQETVTLYEDCPECGGKGYIKTGCGIEKDCEECMGRGYIMRTYTEYTYSNGRSYIA